MNRPSYLLFKKCTKCGEIKHISRFYKMKNGKHGVRPDCKECHNKMKKKYTDSHKEEKREYNKKYYEEHKEELKNNTREWREMNPEYDKKYYEEHKEEKKEYGKKYHKEHKEEKSIRFKKWYEEHKEERNEYCRNWQKNNPHVGFNSHGRRRSRLENQGNGITKEQWFECYEFFNWECAYSGVQLTKENRNLDHIVPLGNGGEHEIWNCVPMYANYNFQKNNKNMLEWYLQQEFFNIERLTKIYEWRIYAYWKWKDEI